MIDKHNMVETLKKCLDETPREVLKKIWEEGGYLDKSGYKVIDYLENKTQMKSLESIKNETAEELGYYSWYEFERLLGEMRLRTDEVLDFIELYATNRVKEVENYYKTQEDEK